MKNVMKKLFLLTDVAARTIEIVFKLEENLFSAVVDNNHTTDARKE